MRTVLLFCLLVFPLFMIAQPRDLEYPYRLEAENFYQQATAFHDHGDLESAGEFYGEAVKWDSLHLKAIYNLALVQYELGKFKAAELSAEKLLDPQAPDASAYELYGLALYHQGIFDRAVASFTLGLSAEKKACLFTNRGLAYAASGQYRAALLDFDDALRMEPNNVIACSAKGATLSKLGQYQLALNWLDKALELQPDDVASMLNRANTFFEMGETDKAEQDFKSAICMGGSADAFLARARCHLMSNQSHAAFQDIKRAIQSKAEDPAVYYLLGEVEMAIGVNVEAIKSFTIALDFNASCVECYLGRSKAFVQHNQLYEAINDLHKVLELDPTNFEAKSMMPEIYGLLDEENSQWLVENKK